VIIVVRGIPAPQGSKRHVGGGRMIESSRAVGPWREAVRAETQRVMTITGPAKRPDLDKLCRSVLDGLTAGGAWEDDAQVVVLRAWKSFATEGTPPRCHIELKEEQ
jgi:crossover junction endodeoxyribonuclease RusA